MAYLHRSNGRVVIQVRLPDGRRTSIRLGKVDARTAAGVKIRIEQLEDSAFTGMSIPSETAMWLMQINDKLHDRLARAHLCKPRESGQYGMKLEAMLDGYLKRRTDLKPQSLAALRTTRNRLIAHFGAGKHVSSFTSADADDFRRALKPELAKATIAKMTVLARQFWADAVRREITTKNPFEGIKPGSQRNPSRLHFVTRDVINRVIEAMPTIQWKLVLAFARYGGVRIPSEIKQLEWSHINWKERRILIHSPKTEHHQGHESRLIPLFPELVPLLLAARQAADPEEERVLPGLRLASNNLRTQLCKMLKKLGIEPWPRIYQNLRSSRQTELAEEFPGHVVCQWLGNSERIAGAHYLQTTEAHFERAAGPSKPIESPVMETKVITPLRQAGHYAVVWARTGYGKSAFMEVAFGSTTPSASAYPM